MSGGDTIHRNLFQALGDGNQAFVTDLNTQCVINGFKANQIEAQQHELTITINDFTDRFHHRVSIQ